MHKKNHPFEDECCEGPDLKQDPVTRDVFEAGRIMNTLKNMVASVCMETIKKQGGNFKDARKIADDVFKTFLMKDKYHTNENWVSLKI